MCIGGGGGDGGAAAAAAERRAQEEARRAKIEQGTQGINAAFQAFDDPFFSGRQQAYIDYQTPFLQDQFSDAKRQLGLTLASSGQSQSSIAAKRFAGLTTDFDNARRQIFDQGRTIANQSRSEVENARSDLINQLNATADPETASGGAARRAEMLSQLPRFDPIGNVFGGVTDGLATAAMINPRGTRKALSSLFQSGGGGSSGRVIS